MDTNILMEKLETQAKRQDDMRQQLDKDRTDIDQIRIDQNAIKEGQQAILKQMTDFKAEIRQQVADTLTVELRKVAKKVIREEIRLLSKSNPKRVLERKVGIIETIKSIFKKNA